MSRFSRWQFPCSTLGCASFVPFDNHCKIRARQLAMRRSFQSFVLETKTASKIEQKNWSVSFAFFYLKNKPEVWNDDRDLEYVWVGDLKSYFCYVSPLWRCVQAKISVLFQALLPEVICLSLSHNCIDAIEHLEVCYWSWNTRGIKDPL